MRSRRLSIKLKERRVAIKMTQRQLAKKIGYQSSQFVSNWERGLCDPPWQMLPKLCEILGLSKDLVREILIEDLKKEVELVFKSRRKGAAKSAV